MHVLRSQATRSLLRQAQPSISPPVRPTCPIMARILCQRAFTSTPSQGFQTSTSHLARKDTQDKDSLKPESSEYSKSGTDDAAADTDEAFNPNKTRPETEKGTSEKESGGQSKDPLDVSPGNPEVSKPRGEQEGGADNSPKSGSGSGAGSAPKNG